MYDHLDDYQPCYLSLCIIIRFSFLDVVANDCLDFFKCHTIHVGVGTYVQNSCEEDLINYHDFACKWDEFGFLCCECMYKH